MVNSFGNEITFDQQGGTGGTSDMLIAKGESFPEITAPTRTGYSFAGYYTLPNGTGTKIYNSDGTTAIETSTFTSATILYAYWLWYDIKNVSGSTTSCVVFEDSDKNICNASLMIYPESGHVVSKFSFDGSTWFVVNSCQKSVSNLSLAAGVVYYASEGTNSFVLDFKGISRNCGVINIYLHTVAGSYLGSKQLAGRFLGSRFRRQRAV